MNNSLSEKLKSSVTKRITAEKDLKNYSYTVIFSLEPNWISGFFNGDGCFNCVIRKSKNS